MYAHVTYNVVSPKRSAKGSNHKEDDRAKSFCTVPLELVVAPLVAVGEDVQLLSVHVVVAALGQPGPTLLVYGSFYQDSGDFDNVFALRRRKKRQYTELWISNTQKKNMG